MNKAEREERLKQQLEDMLTYERALWGKGVLYVGGVDEVGRGPLAGPVCAACVVLPKDFDVIGVNDSKKLSEKKRSELYGVITCRALAYGIGLIGNDRIDEAGIVSATKQAMLIAVADASAMLSARLPDDDYGSDGAGIGSEDPRRAAQRGKAQKSSAPPSSGSEDPRRAAQRGKGPIGHLLVDAVKLTEAGIPGTAIIKGDEKSVSIAAASIVAKVTRDRIMAEFDSIYPGYGFASNKGYGTEAHYAGLRAHGRTPIHRITFLTKDGSKR